MLRDHADRGKHHRLPRRAAFFPRCFSCDLLDHHVTNYRKFSLLIFYFSRQSGRGPRSLVGLVFFRSLLFVLYCFYFYFIFILIFYLRRTHASQNIKYDVLRPCKLQPLCINRNRLIWSDRQKYDIFRTHSSRIRENLAFLLFACTG